MEIMLSQTYTEENKGSSSPSQRTRTPLSFVRAGVARVVQWTKAAALLLQILMIVLLSILVLVSIIWAPPGS
jgi:hypothetical protein